MTDIDNNLIIQLKEGKENAYKYLFDRYYVPLCHVANSYLHDAYMSETIVEDLFSNIWENRESIVITTSLSSYLTRATINNCIKHIESFHSQKVISYSKIIDPIDVEIMDMLDSPESALEKMISKEKLIEINNALDSLPEACKIIFKKCCLEGRKYQEVAEEEGISINTVKYHMKNAYAHLHKCLGKYLFILFLVKF